MLYRRLYKSVSILIVQIPEMFLPDSFRFAAAFTGNGSTHIW